jgi:hypothetical protein
MLPIQNKTILKCPNIEAMVGELLKEWSYTLRYTHCDVPLFVQIANVDVITLKSRDEATL